MRKRQSRYRKCLEKFPREELMKTSAPVPPKKQYVPPITGSMAFLEELKLRPFYSAEEYVTHLHGCQLTEEYFHSSVFAKPVVVRNNEVYGLKIPITTNFLELLSYLKEDIKIVEVVDVLRQIEMNLTLQQFKNYIMSGDRTNILDLRRLEISCTRLGSLINAPDIINFLDLKSRYWREPFGYPVHNLARIDKYLIISPINAYTDFHVDFSGTSKWIHIVRGKRLFYLIDPMEPNHMLYWSWMKSLNRLSSFFGDQVISCKQYVLGPGSTIFIPSGWIYAELTLEDTIAYCGHFFSFYHLSLQLEIYEMETQLNLERNYIYPNFQELFWIISRGLRRDLQQFNSPNTVRHLPEYLVEGLQSLLRNLHKWNRYARSCFGFHESAIILRDLTRELKPSGKKIPVVKCTRAPPTRSKKLPVYVDGIHYLRLRKKSLNPAQIIHPKPLANSNKSSSTVYSNIEPMNEHNYVKRAAPDTINSHNLMEF